MINEHTPLVTSTSSARSLPPMSPSAKRANGPAPAAAAAREATTMPAAVCDNASDNAYLRQLLGNIDVCVNLNINAVNNTYAILV